MPVRYPFSHLALERAVPAACSKISVGPLSCEENAPHPTVFSPCSLPSPRAPPCASAPIKAVALVCRVGGDQCKNVPDLGASDFLASWG